MAEEWVCQRCGECCQNVGLAFREQGDDMAQFLKLHRLRVTPHPDGSDRFLLNLPGLKCNWLGWDGLHSYCKRYSERPQMCRDYCCGEKVEA